MAITKTTTNIFFFVVIFCSLALSAHAIRCHQCNSHIDEDCNELRLSTPRGPRDNHFLKECEANEFCRKTVVTIEVTGEHRIVRGCGSIQDTSAMRNNTCFSNDNEGLAQTICSCFEDGCNAAPTLSLSGNILAVSGVSLMLATRFGRSA